MAGVFTLKALGLSTQPNQIEAPPGSLTVAKNVNITRTDVVEPRRGFKLYGNSFGSVSDVAKQLFSYKLRILRHFNNTLQFDANGSGAFSSFNGAFTEAQTGLRTKSAEMNGNLYLTSSDGIKKISALTAADFSTASGVVANAGAIAAVDITGTPNYSYGDQTDFLVQDSAVAYRAVWGYRDNNNNLLLGTPSQRIEVYNYLLNLLLQDYMVMLGALDNIGYSGAMIDNKNYVNSLKLNNSNSATDLYNNLLSLTAKLDNDIVYADNYHDQGNWNASTNTPTLHNNVRSVNDTYIVTTGGTQNLGNGSVAYNVNDVLRYDGTEWTVDTNYTYKGTWDPSYVFVGTWNANTNSPTLADGTGTTHNFYRVTTAGTQNLGSGSQTFAIGDFIYYTGTQWLKSTSIIYLADGTGTDGDLYRVSVAGAHTFSSGTINFAANDFITYNGTIWSKVSDLTYINDWNANTNSPTIYSTAIKNGFFYTVSVGGTQNLGNGSVTYNVNDRVIYKNGLWTVDNSAIVSNSPLKITSAVIDNGICTVTFGSGNPSLYVVSGNKIALSGFNIDNVTPGLNIDTTTNPVSNFQTVASTTSTTITFNTDVVGVVNIDATAEIVSGDFRGNITQPITPVIPSTDQDLVGLQNYISGIYDVLNQEPNAVIPTAVLAQYIAPLTLTKASNVTLNITIPQGITSQYFFQIYRSSTFIATGVQVLSTDVIPNDELQLVYEAFPTAAELSAGTITVVDITPDAFLGANLYTNASTGQGILQSNDLPPFALDINVFKNSMFYANTHTRHQLDISLLGVQNMITDFNNGIIPKLTVATSAAYNTYSFIVGSQETFTITCNAGSTLAASGTASYFDVNSGNNVHTYRFWYNIGTAVAPASGGRTLVPILATALDTNIVISEKTRDALNILNFDFSATAASHVVSGTCLTEGITTAISAGTSGFAVAVIHAGTGENASAKQILLSSNASPAIAVQLTAQSLVRVINQDSSESIYAYYTSGVLEVPGKMTFQSRILGGLQFFLVTNDTNTGASFSPSLAPTLQISSIAIGGPTANLVTTSTNHGLTNLDYIFVSGSNSTPSIDGYQQITYVSPTTFRVNATITVLGTKGGIIPYTVAESSSNNTFANRVYYSKLQQPEAVPALNFFDVGAKDKAILRIYPLRDSLFILKQDGIYRISGESIPFNLGLFDSSAILIAPDSVSSINNVIYGWTRQGITSITESGTRNISRPIDVNLLPLASAQYTNFAQSTWGIGYESDKSYSVYTLTKTGDTNSTQGWKYNTLTNAWTYTDRSAVCGVINFPDDKMYTGAGDINFIEQERKNYDRTDFSDREYTLNVQVNSAGTSIVVDSTTHISPDDVFVQSQPYSIYTFNALLKKIDAAPAILTKNFYSTLVTVPGDNLRTKLVALATKLDASSLSQTNYAAAISDLSGTISAISTGPVVTVTTSSAHGLVTGRTILLAATNSTPNINGEYQITVTGASTFTIEPGFTVTTVGTSGNWATVSSNFNDLFTNYNTIISKLNTDSVLSVNNFQSITDFVNQEVLITAVNVPSKTITVAQVVSYVQGDITLYKAIDCQVQYAPYTFGNDPISAKHIRESQIMFDNLAFTKGTLSFATDLMPALIDVPFNGDGPGLFGLNGTFGSGFFGGASDSAPIRTYIPRNCQRCRYMVVKFSHKVARDKWALNGITLTGDIIPSSRAFR